MKTKYYDIEALDGMTYKQTLNRGMLSVTQMVGMAPPYNDSLFLNDILMGVEMCYGKDNWIFADILKAFYNHYKGDRNEWLHHTANIIYSMKNLQALMWIEREFDKVAGKQMTQKDVLLKYDYRISHRGTNTLKTELIMIAEPYGWSWKGLRKTWYSLKCNPKT